MNIGAVPYLNALPLIHGLDNPRLEVPAALDRLLRIGELDLATAPITSLFEHPNWRIIDGIGIGTRGAIQSVRLVIDRPDVTIREIGSIYLGMESKTSSLLLKILLYHKYGRSLEEILFTGPIPAGGEEGRLVIGDKALQLSEADDAPPSIDLGSEWTEWTKLPFVFAGWVSRRPNLPEELLDRLRRAPSLFFNAADTILATRRDLPFPASFVKDYLTENVSYRFGAAEKKGLTLFQRYAADLGLTPKEWELNCL